MRPPQRGHAMAMADRRRQRLRRSHVANQVRQASLKTRPDREIDQRNREHFHGITKETDTGKTTPFLGTDTQPIDLVSVRCVGHLCTTDVVPPPADAGQDVPPNK